MANRLEKNQALLTSVFDRLADDEPELSREVAKTGSQALRDLKQSVRRDLQNLLNTRRRLLDLPADLTELATSLVAYGLPDFTSSHLRAAQDPRAFTDLIADAVARFEPRLINVRVELSTKPDQKDRVLRFRIDAVLFVDPISDNVSFDSSFEPEKGAFEIQRGAT